jgi:hypothetical protein
MSQYALLTILALVTMGIILVYAIAERVVLTKAKAKVKKERLVISHRCKTD